jgi:aryl-alcohol dehydrogenase-like predicted oxidoreductase
VRQGKVRYLGCSTFPAWMTVEAHWASERRALERFVCEQPPYSIFHREVERDVFPVTQRYGMGVIVWSPLAGGWLTGKYRRGKDLPPDSRAARVTRFGGQVAEAFNMENPVNQRKMDLVEDLAAVADKAGLSLTHMGLAFTVAHPAVTCAITGPRTMDQLEDLLAAADVRLDDEILDAIDEIAPPGEAVDPADRLLDMPWMKAEARRRP